MNRIESHSRIHGPACSRSAGAWRTSRAAVAGRRTRSSNINGDGDASRLTSATGEVTHLRPHDDPRQLVTIVFFDIVRSTSRVHELGDRAWCQLLSEFYTAAGKATSLGGGRVVNTTGDGFVAVFDAPGQAIGAANAVRVAVDTLGLSVRGGVHAAEVERLGDDIVGIGVHIGARVAEVAAEHEIWVSRTVCDLVAGSGIRFERRGGHRLAGLDEEWELFAVVDA